MGREAVQMDENIINTYLEGEKITLIDVGARDGIDGRWNSVSSLLNVVGFEPDEEECRRLNEEASSRPYQSRCFPYALGRRENSEAKLHICKAPGCSSLFEPNSDFVNEFRFGQNMELVGSQSVSLTTLDDVCSKERILPDCMKIDTQGSEFDILSGSLSILQHVKMLELEVEFNFQYKNQPLFSDIDSFLRSKGFVLLGLRRTNWRRLNRTDFPTSPFGGQIIHGDAIYYNGRLLDETQCHSAKSLIKFCIVLSAYKQDDFVAYLLGNAHGALKDLPDAERRALANWLMSTPTGLSSLLGTLLGFSRGMLGLSHKKLRRLLDTLQSSKSEAWHDPNFF